MRGLLLLTVIQGFGEPGRVRAYEIFIIAITGVKNVRIGSLRINDVDF